LSTPVRLAAFAAVLALVGAAAAVVGASSRGNTRAAKPPPMAMGHEEMAAAPRTNGLATSAAGFSFEPRSTALSTGRNDFRFRIADAHGAPAHDFNLEGGVRLHLIVVRRDLTGYTHVHPRLQADGSWRVPLTFSEPGVYRAYTDFEANGHKTVLGRDLFVAGDMRPQPLPRPAPTTSAGPYTIDLAPQELHAGKPATFHFTVSRNGIPVEKFETYVGMRGHLVALHAGDLAYTHVHPLAGSARGKVEFKADLTAPGTYRLFLQFKENGHVYTAPFTVEVQR
jgi:hypothetical protein